MIKKTILGTAIVLGLVAVVWGTRPFSYVKTWIKQRQADAEARVPIDLKINNARDEIADLAPAIRKCMHSIAEQQTDIEYLDRKITRKSSSLEKQKLAILALREKLGTGQTQFVYAGRAHSAGELKLDLSRWYHQYRVAETALQREQNILAARKKAVAANERKLDEMLNARKELEVALEELVARHEELKAAKITSSLEFDDSQVSVVRAKISKIRRQLDVEQKLLNTEGRFVGGPVIDIHNDKPRRDITEEIDAHFNGGGTSIEEVAAGTQ